MEEVIKTIGAYLEKNNVTKKTKCIVSTNIYNTLEVFEYKGLKIQCNKELPYNFVMVF